MRHQLADKLLKSDFHVYETILLVHVINDQEVKMNTAKLKTMSKCPILRKKKQVQLFLGFANYYYRFITNFSGKVHYRINLTQDVPFTQ